MLKIRQFILTTDKNPDVIAFMQTALGKLAAILMLTAGLIIMNYSWWWLITPIIALILFLPQHRQTLMTLGTLLAITCIGWDHWDPDHAYKLHQLYWSFNHPEIKILVFCYCSFVTFCAVYIAKKFKRPITSLLIVIVYQALAITTLFHSPLSHELKATLWRATMIFGNYIWFIGYLCLNAKNINKKNALHQLAFLTPFWYQGSVAIGKGARYLNRVTQHNTNDIAISQIKGLKLLIWATLLYLLYIALAYVFNSIHPITLSIAMHKLAEHQHLSRALCWWILVRRFVLIFLNLAIVGHMAIALLRLCGFRALRNMYKPLQATTIAEFWNRYYYYFKELLCDFFFYPSYFRFFKNYPRCRLFFSIFLSVGVGNFIFHLFYYAPPLEQQGLWGAIKAMHVYFYYGLILSISIFISQLRHQGRHLQGGFFKNRIVRPGIVVVFYMLMTLINSSYLTQNMSWNINFLLYMLHLPVLP